MKVPPLSFVFADLYRRYKKEGLSIYGSYSPYFGAPKITGTYIARDNIFLSTSGGIANDEATFIYGLCEQTTPKKILVIGNSYGFSTVFLALTNPTATLIAFDKYRTEGIKTTNRLLSGLKNKKVVQASTPNDIAKIIEKELGGSVDLVLIDAVHTNDIQTAEFKVLDDYLSNKSVVIFHDVVSCNLLESLLFLKKTYTKYNFSLITKSTSGIAVCIKGNSSEDIKDYISYHSTEAKNVYDFCALMLKETSIGIDLFSDCNSRFNFLPHPQL